jgi:anti-sigma-K factor RskA
VNAKDIISSGILELYVLGLSSAAENAEVEQWTKEYPELLEEIAAIELAMEKLAKANAVAPAPSLKSSIFAKINASEQSAETTPTVAPAPVYAISRNWKMIAAASIGIFLVSATFNLIYFNKYSVASNSLEETKSLLEKEQLRTKEFKTDLDLVKNPNNTMVALKGMDNYSNATAKIFWFQETGEVGIDASNLPDAPSGMQYQFWAIVDGKPVDGGMIITSDKGKKYRIQKMKSFGKAQAFAISLEKAGGNPTPTTVVSLGKII